MNDNPGESSALVKGIGIALGQCIFGVNGPFLFSRLGVPDGVAAALGVLLGATLGYGLATAGWRVRNRELLHRHTGRHIGIDAPVGANL